MPLNSLSPIAILFEVAGITSMKLSRGFAELLPSVGVIVFYVCSFAAAILALERWSCRSSMPCGRGWHGADGVDLASLILREPLTLIKLGLLALVSSALPA